MPVAASEFRRALAEFSSGITVVTTRGGDGPLGLTVSSFCSVSLEPPLVLVCIDNRSDTQAGIRDSGSFAISVLEESQADISRQFAAPGPAKFDGVSLDAGELGIPVVRGALAHIECLLHAEHPAGDHVIFVGRVDAVRVSPGRPLAYHRGQYRRLSTAPSPAHGAPQAGGSRPDRV